MYPVRKNVLFLRDTIKNSTQQLFSIKKIFKKQCVLIIFYVNVYFRLEYIYTYIFI